MVPLSRHVLFETGDVDCARERVARKFCSHRLAIIGEQKRFRAVHNHVSGDMISLNYISYGADVLIDPGALDDFYLIQILLSGGATIRDGRREFPSDRRVASVLNADLATRMRWWSGCAQVLVQIRKAPFIALAERLLDRELPSRVVFDPAVDLRRPELRSWLHFTRGLFRTAETRGDAALGPGIGEQRLVDLFVNARPSTMSLFLEGRVQGAAPRHLRRAEAFIRANAGAPITLLDIAEAAGVVPRTLQLAYKAATGMSPMLALARERLHRVRFDLRSGEARSVAEMARKWGFMHLGRFAADYRREFGETPRDTLRSAA